MRYTSDSKHQQQASINRQFQQVIDPTPSRSSFGHPASKLRHNHNNKQAAGLLSLPPPLPFFFGAIEWTLNPFLVLYIHLPVGRQAPSSGIQYQKEKEKGEGHRGDEIRPDLLARAHEVESRNNEQDNRAGLTWGCVYAELREVVCSVVHTKCLPGSAVLGWGDKD